MNFFKNILSSFLGVCLAVVVFIVLSIGIIAAVSSKNTVKVKENSILVLDFSGGLKDYVSMESDALNQVLGLEENLGFNQLIKTIGKARFDDNIKGICIKKIPSGMGWAQATTLRNKLEAFKSSGKKVWSYADYYTQKHYYLASVADSLVLSPMGFVELKGLHSEVMFYKNLQEKYGVKMEVIRHGKFKSAVEPYLSDKMSENNRHQIGELIHSLWSTVKNSLETSRGIDVKEAVYNLQGKLPEVALQNGLVDKVSYEDDFNKSFKNAIEGKSHMIGLEKYIQANGPELDFGNDAKIAVIYAQGSIIYGKGDENKIGQKLINKSFYKAVKDDKVKAIVLRINSPGGSALASDLMWNAIEKAKVKKPVIVSMGNVAASGGYYIVCNADKIFAEPTTITGSIGVFGMLPNATGLTKSIGINAEVVSTHDNGAYYSVIKPITNEFKATVKKGIEHVYNTFVQKVAAGRHMTFDEVDAVAQGRVWTGIQAKEIGLVDELGSLQDAIAYAAKKVELSNYGIAEYPKYEMDFKSMLGGGNPFMKMFDENSIQQNLLEKLNNFQEVLNMEGAQTRIPFEIVIE